MTIRAKRVKTLGVLIGLIVGASLLRPPSNVNQFESMLTNQPGACHRLDDEIFLDGPYDTAGNDYDLLEVITEQTAKGPEGGTAVINGSYIIAAGHVPLEEGDTIRTSKGNVKVKSMLLKSFAPGLTIGKIVPDISLYVSGWTGYCIPIGETPDEASTARIIGYPKGNGYEQWTATAQIQSIDDMWGVYAIDDPEAIPVADTNAKAQGLSGGSMIKDGKLIGVLVSGIGGGKGYFYSLDNLNVFSPDIYGLLVDQPGSVPH